MTRLNVRLDHLLREARALRHAQVLADDPARPSAVKLELMARLNRLHAALPPEKQAAARAMSESEVAAVLESCHAQLRERMERNRARS